MLVLGFVGALLLVLYPLAYRVSREQATTAARPATARPIVSHADATARPTARPTVTPPDPPSDPRSSEPALETEPSWLAQATEHRGQNESTFRYGCPADGSINPVWGTDFYTDDSSVCTAAVHAGLITLAAGGTVKIKILPGLDAYVGSTRNGVRSSSYDRWEGSYMFVVS